MDIHIYNVCNTNEIIYMHIMISQTYQLLTKQTIVKLLFSYKKKIQNKCHLQRTFAQPEILFRIEDKTSQMHKHP